MLTVKDCNFGSTCFLLESYNVTVKHCNFGSTFFLLKSCSVTVKECNFASSHQTQSIQSPNTMSCVHWSSDEKSAFESTLKAWAVKKQFRLDAKGWPRISDWEALKAAILVRGRTIPLVKTVFERPTSVLKTRYSRLKSKRMNGGRTTRVRWSYEERIQLKTYVESGRFGSSKIKWSELVNKHYNGVRTANALQLAWKKGISPLPSPSSTDAAPDEFSNCGICKEVVIDQVYHFKCCQKTSHVECVKDYAIAEFNKRGRGCKAIPKTVAISCMYCRQRQVLHL